MQTLEYRGYRIKFAATRTASTPRYWYAHAYIQYDEGGIFRSVPRTGPINRFRTKDETEFHILQDARKWVDDRILRLDKNARGPLAGNLGVATIK
jgi:hypothetical protein